MSTRPHTRFTRSPLTLALATALLVPSLPALAQNKDSDEVKELDKVTVTGSRIKRAEVEGALPVTVITREQLDTSGKTTVSDYLRDTSFNSFGSFQSTSGSSGIGASTISLRGLGSQRTLILVDGRRMPNAPQLGSSQNLNSIPMAAVERIEILSDGASAIYGSDALGGVVNIITRKDYDGMEVTYGRGFPTEEGGDTEEMSILMGTSGNQGRVMAGASHSSREIVFTRDRDYLYNVPGASVFSNNFATTTSFTTTGRLKHPTNGAAVPGDCISNTNLFYTSPASGTGRNCQFDHAATSAQLTSLDNTAIFVRGDRMINADWTVYASADVSRVKSFGRFAPVPSSPWPGGAIVLAPGTPNHPGTPKSAGGLNPDQDAYYAQFNNQPIYLFHRFAALGPRNNNVKTDTYNFIAGVEGTIGRFDVDVGARYSESSGANIGTNYVVAGLAQPHFTSGAYNIYNPTAASATIKNGMITNTSRDLKTSIKEAFVNVSFDLFAMRGGAATAAVGAEYREEFYQDIYDPLSEAGQVVGSAGNSASGGRDIQAAYAEVLFPILPSFEMNLAGRFDKYSDYGSDFAPKISARWHPIDSFTMRASYGEGFRAPGLDLLTQKTTFSANATSDPQTCLLLTGKTSCATQVTTYRIANPNLESEQSEQWSAGVVWDADKWLSMALDYYNIEITNQISTTSLATIVACLRGQPALCPSGLRTFPVGTVLPNESLGVGAQFDPTTGGIVNAQLGSVNLGFIETSGFDFSARTSFDLGWTRMRNSLTVGYVDNYSVNGAASVVGVAGVPKMRANLNTGLSFADSWDFTWNTSYIHGTKARPGDPSLPSWTIHNVQLSYRAPWDATVTFGVRNIANKDPVFNPALGGTSYDSTLYDLFGRVPYFRYTQRF